jgi:hypothetical protein
MTEWVAVEPLRNEPTAIRESVGRAFKVGDCVRVRLSGECQFHHLGNAHLTSTYTLIDALRDGTLGGPGFMGANGAIGVIEAICPSEDDDDGHPYLVSDTDGSGHWDQVDDFFAESELELA